jgi:tetratricopeptide (TPR) repeat protein
LWEALPLSRGVDTGRLEAVVEGNLGQAFIGLGRYQKALEHGERGLALRRRSGDLHGEPWALHMLARGWLGLGEHETVISLCRKAIELGRRVGHPTDTVAGPLDTLAISLNHTGRTAEAATCWREAAILFDHHGRRERADEVRHRLHSAHPGTGADDGDRR